jgi:hypothetical protein
LNADGFSLFGHHSMESCAPNATRAAQREFRIDGCATIQEADAAKRPGIGGAQRNSKIQQSRNRVRHQAFAASFVRGRKDAIGYGHAAAFPTHRDRRSQTGGSPADNENIRLYHRDNTSSEQNPGPIAASTCTCPEPRAAAHKSPQQTRAPKLSRCRR